MTLTRSEAREYLSNNPELILQSDRHGGYICPICGSGGGKHGTGLFVERDKQHYSCFAGGCFKNKSIFDIIGLQYGLTSFKDMMNKAAELAGVLLVSDTQGSYTTRARSERPAPEHIEKSEPSAPPDTDKQKKEQKPQRDYINAFHYWHSFIDQTDYWKKRGLTRETMSRFKVGYYPDYKIYGDNGKIAAIWKALILPVTRHSYAVRNTDENAPSEERHRKVGSGKTLYNPLNINFANPETAFFVVEGEIDALSVIQSGGAAIALRSAANVPIFIEKLLANPPKSPCYVLGLLDMDEAGRKANSEIEAALKGSDIFLFEGFKYSPFHDPNDWLIQDPESFKQFVTCGLNTATRIMKESARNAD